MAGENIVLSYHDSLVRECDFKLLDSPNWLNDTIIGFCFEYFTNDKFVNLPFTFISPEVTQFMKFCGAEELEIFLEPLELLTKEIVFLAVNDNSDVEKTGGSHWSLLAYCRKGNKFQHYDSSNGSNEKYARQLSKKMWRYLGVGNEPSFTEMPVVPQQTNSHDCGVYVICVAAHLGSHHSGENIGNMSDVITPNFVKKKRQEVKELILSLGCKK